MKPPAGLRGSVLGFDCLELGLQSKTDTDVQNIPGFKLSLINVGLFALDQGS